MVYNKSMKMICPLCGEFFHPSRRGQLYCSSAHGWEYRNQTNQVKNEEEKQKRLNQINNLRILVKLQMEGEYYPNKDRLKELGFDFSVLTRCLYECTDRNSKERYYEVYGFLIFISPADIFVYAPWDESNLLFNGDE